LVQQRTNRLSVRAKPSSQTNHTHTNTHTHTHTHTHTPEHASPRANFPPCGMSDFREKEIAGRVAGSSATSAGFIRFLLQLRDSVREQFPSYTLREVAAVLRSQWDALPAHTKAVCFSHCHSLSLRVCQWPLKRCVFPFARSLPCRLEEVSFSQCVPFCIDADLSHLKMLPRLCR
jgi:hypothetical protein